MRRRVPARFGRAHAGPGSAGMRSQNKRKAAPESGAAGKTLRLSGAEPAYGIAFSSASLHSLRSPSFVRMAVTCSGVIGSALLPHSWRM